MSKMVHSFHIANKILQGRCSTQNGIKEIGNELDDEVIYLVKELNNNTITEEWQLIENELENPTVLIKTYLLSKKKEIILRSNAMIPKYYLLIKNILERIERITELLPSVLETEDFDEFFINNVITMDPTKFYGRITHSYRYKEISPHECAHVFSHFQQPIWNHHLFYAKDQNKMTLFIMQSKFLIQENSKGSLFHLINLQRKFINNIFDHISGDQEVKDMMFLERRFNKMVYNQDVFPVIIHRNAVFNVFANYDFTEIVIKGSSEYHQKFSVLLEDLEHKVYSNIIYPKSILLKKGNCQNCFHKESPFFSKELVSTDLIIGKTVSEGNIFFGCQSVGQGISLCQYHHVSPVKFAVVLSAERTETFNGKAKSIFYYHYFVPELNLNDVKRFSGCIRNIIIAKLIMRIGFEQNVSLKIDRSNSGDFNLSKNMLFCALQIKRTIEDRKRLQQLERKKNITKINHCFICLLDNNSFHYLIKTLCLEDLMSLRCTCTRFKKLIDESTDVWKNFYDLYHNPQTQPKTFFTSEHNDIKNYSLLVRKCYKVRQNWRNKKWSKRSILTPFYAPINYIRVKNDDCIVVGSENGYFSRIETKNNEFIKVREGLPMSLLAGMRCSFDYSNDLYVYFRSGEIRKYTNSTLKFTKYECHPYEKVSFVNNSIVVGLNDTTLSVVDFISQKTLNKFVPHSVEITHFCCINPNIVVSSSIDGTIAGFDLRSNKFAFRTLSYREELTSFDWIDDFIISGSCKGRMKMWDLRTNMCCCERTIHFNAINSMFCFNRKVVSGGTDKAVYCCDLSRGWFENVLMMYMHPSTVTCVSLNDCTLSTGSEDGVLISSQFC
ncbi:WD domain, G-beta repeat-containing protein [Entamoeba histolytica HM-3:IMSS]|uniref:WD domain Gbeta repeat-containing protein n=2 Tax=Entamoeba histolytica TaxID=5759 RepID=M2Q0C2_ENTHI|nr:WD domain Gbeta repeat-containing protein [Entamoeba histolytica KU27]EMS15668.1 WD domain, G-beta repeat-containing protein [Entamoeba histolytica HM-3:IMSS]